MKRVLAERWTAKTIAGYLRVNRDTVYEALVRRN